MKDRQVNERALDRLRRSLAPMLGITLFLFSAVALLLAQTGTPPYAQALREKNYPASIAALSERYTFPPHQKNAAVPLMIAGAKLENVRLSGFPPEFFDRLPHVGDAKLPAPGEPIPAGMANAVRTYLNNEEIGEVLALVYEGASKKGARYPILLDLALNISFRHASRLGQIQELLQLHALHYMIENRPEGVVRVVQAELQLANSLAAEPLIFSQQLRSRYIWEATLDLKQALACVSFQQKQLARLQRAFSLATPEMRSLRDAIAGEIAIYLDVRNVPFGMNYWGGWEEVPSPHSRSVHWLLRLFENATGKSVAEDVATARLLSSYIKLMEQPLHEAVKAPLFVEYDSIEPHISPNLFNSSLNVDKNRLLSSFASSAASAKIAITALAIERYRLENRQLPQSLAELVPQYVEELPTDPFSGEALRYKETENGYVVYSVGPDREDDGGREPEEDTSILQDGDIVFKVFMTGQDGLVQEFDVSRRRNSAKSST